jgi:hypothetical protein
MARWLVMTPLLVATMAPGVARSAPSCERAEEGPTVALQSSAWRAAVDALRDATSDRNQPWGCNGGSIDLVEHDGRATLMVRGSDGAMISREVESPDDVVPLGEALLARPESAAPKAPVESGNAAPVAAAPQRPSDQPPPPVSPVRTDPRVIASAVVAPRYAGRANLMLGGVTAAVGLPFSSWVPALWVRFDGPLATLEDHGTPLMEFCVGGAFGRSFPVKELEIRASVNGSAAVIIKPEHMDAPGETHLDGRIGAEARFAFPRTSLVRAVVTTDTELAPGNFGDHSRHDPTRPPPLELPSYTLGLGVGVEIAPR